MVHLPYVVTLSETFIPCRDAHSSLWWMLAANVEPGPGRRREDVLCGEMSLTTCRRMEITIPRTVTKHPDTWQQHRHRKLDLNLLSERRRLKLNIYPSSWHASWCWNVKQIFRTRAVFLKRSRVVYRWMGACWSSEPSQLWSVRVNVLVSVFYGDSHCSIWRFLKG